jgi:hypothetical protein
MLLVLCRKQEILDYRTIRRGQRSECSACQRRACGGEAQRRVKSLVSKKVFGHKRPDERITGTGGVAHVDVEGGHIVALIQLINRSDSGAASGQHD